MKKISLLLIFTGFVCCMGVQAQNITYTYDASGNRISRSQKSQAMRSSSLKSSTTGSDEVYSSKTIDFEQILLTNKNSIKIFPNPNKGQFQIEMTGFDDVLNKGVISIFSSLGRVVLKLSSLQQLNSINLSSQPNGTYVLQININGKAFTHKVVISK